MERAQGLLPRLAMSLVLVIAAFVCVAEQPAGQAQPVAPGAATDSAALDRLRATLKEAVDNNRLSGVSLLLEQDGRVIFKAAYGDLSVNDRVKIASSTKPVAAVGILMLVDEGKLHLDDTVGDLLPEFKGTKVERATLRQLLSHKGGILGSYPGGRPTRGSLAEFSRLIAKKGSLDPPGRFNYSGVSIDIACRMAEVAAGIPMEDHLKSRVFVPLDMTHTEFVFASDPGSVSSADRARGEGRYISCGGGLSSALDDMANFYEMLLHRGVYKGQRLLSEELYGEMVSLQGTNPRKTSDPYTTGEYGLGIYRDRVAADGSPITISHGGALGTMPWVDLDTGLVGVFFSRSRLHEVMPVIADVQAEARGQEFSPVAPPVNQDRTRAPAGQTRAGQRGIGNQRSSDRVFNRISGGADVINLKQLQDFIDTLPSDSRLKSRPDTAERLFKRLDRNNDGVLTQEEYSEMQSLRR